MSSLPCAELLRQKDLKVTTARCEVLCALSGESHPTTVKGIMGVLKKKAPNIVTLYRILKSFVEKGLVREMTFYAGEAMYEVAKTGDHHHIVCTQCHAIEELDSCAVGSVIKRIGSQSKQFAVITRHTFELYGVCRSCMMRA